MTLHPRSPGRSRRAAKRSGAQAASATRRRASAKAGGAGRRRRSGQTRSPPVPRTTARRSRSIHDPIRAQEGRLASALLDWFASAQRTLPWRESYEPYAVWIAEMMLQQTQVETVLPYYRRWMEQFPTVFAVARAPLEAVLKAWEGLGYYGRARHLHRTAQALVERHGGRLPDDLDALRALPGVGPYTAGAIASIAFNRPVPLVDGNVARVLGRLHADQSQAASAAGRASAWAAAGRLLEAARAAGGQPRDFNQALMELGALICRPRAPRCLLCPWRADCRARLSGDPEAFPSRRARRTRPVRHGAMLIAQANARSGEPRWLIRRRPAQGIWGGLWEFPWAERRSERESAESLCAALLAESGGTAPRKNRFLPLGHVSHGLTHFQLELDCLVLNVSSARAGRTAKGKDALERNPAVRWVSRTEFEALPLARLSHKALALLDRAAALQRN